MRRGSLGLRTVGNKGKHRIQISEINLVSESIRLFYYEYDR